MSRVAVRIVAVATLCAVCAAVAPCAVILAQDKCMRDVAAELPSGKELIREFTTFHEHFADEHDEFWRFIRRLATLYNCSSGSA